MWRNRNPCALGMQTAAATVENNLEVPEKNKLPYHLVIALLGIYPKNVKTKNNNNKKKKTLI